MKKLFLSLLMLAALAAGAFYVLPAGAETIQVMHGDTLSAIAQRFGTTVGQLAEVNDIKNPDLILAGSSLQVGGDDMLGIRIPTVVALYTDSLASRISESATSFTLIRGTDKQDRALNGYYGFVIDEGVAASEEFFTANCVTASTTACTIVARGIDMQDGKTEVTTLKHEHRRGATVKITNFPQLAILSRILQGLESASSTFMIGDGSTTTTLFKTIYNDNGTANKPYFRYNEVAQRWQFSDDGLNSVNFATSTASGLSASTTRGVFITDSQIGINASSTASLAFDTNGYLYVDPIFYRPTFFFGNVTSTGTFTVNTPTSSRDAVNKSYSDNNLQTLSATGTLGVSVTYGQALYMSTTGTLFLADSDATASTLSFAGFALEAGSVGNTIKYARTGAVVTGLSGLVQGSNYYLSGTSGGLSLTAGTVSARVALALSTTSIVVLKPSFRVAASGGVNLSINGQPQSVVLGWAPTRIDFLCSGSSAHNSTGVWIANSNGSASMFYRGTDDDAIPYEQNGTGRVCQWEETANTFSIFAATTTDGFYVSSTNSLSTSRNVDYIAEYISE